jgi:hypothetical protein
VNVAVGTLIYREGAYIIDKFLANQKQIQQVYPLSMLIFATSEADFIDDLNRLITSWELNATVIHYEVVKPHYAGNRIWNITCGREALRDYVLSKTGAHYLLFLDADSILDPSVIVRMKEEIKGYDVVFSGYPLRNYGIGLAGCGCLMLTREVLEKIAFRCYEFKNGEVIFEDNVLEVDLFNLRSRIKKGFFVRLEHYRDENDFVYIDPQPVGIFRKAVNSAFPRYLLNKMSILMHCNIPWRFKVFYNKLIKRFKTR